MISCEKWVIAIKLIRVRGLCIPNSIWLYAGEFSRTKEKNAPQKWVQEKDSAQGTIVREYNTETNQQYLGARAAQAFLVSKIHFFLSIKITPSTRTQLRRHNWFERIDFASEVENSWRTKRPVNSKSRWIRKKGPNRKCADDELKVSEINWNVDDGKKITLMCFCISSHVRNAPNETINKHRTLHKVNELQRLTNINTASAIVIGANTIRPTRAVYYSMREFGGIVVVHGVRKQSPSEKCHEIYTNAKHAPVWIMPSIVCNLQIKYFLRWSC